jgi:hypothetical protein
MRTIPFKLGQHRVVVSFGILGLRRIDGNADFLADRSDRLVGALAGAVAEFVGRKQELGYGKGAAGRSEQRDQGAGALPSLGDEGVLIGIAIDVDPVVGGGWRFRIGVLGNRFFRVPDHHEFGRGEAHSDFSFRMDSGIQSQE